MIVWLGMLALLLLQGPGRSGTPFGTIAGRVLNQTGSPAAGLRIGALAVPEPGQGLDSAMLSVAQTDADGRYRLQDVPAGRYYIAAGPLDGLTYFPSTSATAKAIVVTMQPRAELMGIDFTLATAPQVRISGVIVREDNSTAVATPPPNAAPAGFAALGGRGGATSPAQVRLTGAGPMLSAAISADGTFEFSNVRPGTYQATIMPPALRVPPVTLTVGDTDLTGVRLIVPLLVNIGGSVTVENNGPQPRFQMIFTPFSATGAAAAPAGPSALINPISLGTAASALQLAGATSVMAAAAFNALLPVGDYRITTAGLPVGFTIKSMTADSSNLLDDLLKVTATSSPNIRVTLSISPEAWTRVSGRIVSRGAAGMTPNILIAGGAINAIEAPTADVYLDGSFEFPKVLTGTYQIRVAPPQDVAPPGPGLTTQINVTSAPLTGVRLEAPFANFGPPQNARDGVPVTGRIVGRARRDSPARVFLSASSLPEDLVAPIYWDGSFEFPAVPPGTYAANVRPAVPGAKPTMVTIGNNGADIEVRVPATREVVGRLAIEGSSAPLPRTAAFIIAPSGDAADTGMAMTIATPVQTDGSFRLTLPEGGIVRLATNVLPSGYTVESLTYGSTDAQTQPIGFELPESTELRVKLNASRVAVAKVSGRVLGTVSPSSHMWLSAVSRLAGSLETEVGADGTFTFSNVPPGTYTLRLAAVGIPAISAPGAVEAAGQDITGLEVTAPHLAAGRATLKGGQAPRFSLPLRSESGETAITIDPQTDGSFRVALPVGVWQVGAPVGLPAGIELVSITYGSADAGRAALRVAASDTAELNITLSR